MKNFRVEAAAKDSAPKDLQAALAEAEQTGVLRIPAESLVLSLPGTGTRVEVCKNEG